MAHFCYNLKVLLRARLCRFDGGFFEDGFDAAGADGFFYMDFGQFVKLGAGAMGAGENPMLSNLRLPLWVSYRSGKSPALEMRIPMELARGVAAFAPMLMGLGMGMGAQQPVGP